MRPAPGIIVRALLLTVAALLVIGLAAPFIGAGRYGQQIREAMERGLNRKVEIGNVTFNLFTGPGFTVEDVIIYDDPSAGIEPFAHMTSLEARVRLSALLAGRIEFSRLRFVEPSINIVKPATGPWNIMPLLQRTVAANVGADVARLPEIQVNDGRINFKFGERKSAFYFMNADVTVAPRTSEKGAFLLRFSGEPARTDRAAQGFGEFKAAGRLLTGGAESRLELDIDLEKGEIGDLVTLVRGQPAGVHGMIAASAKVYGPVSDLQILGTVNVDEVHRWDVMPARTGGLLLTYRGSLNAASQRLELAAGPRDNPDVPVSARLIVDGVLSKPRWSADLSIDGMPASHMLAIARHMGAPIPRGVAVKGNIVGIAGYGPEAGLQGQLVIDGATVKLGNGPELTVEHAGLLLAGEELRLTPASISGGGRSAELEVIFSPTRQRFDATIRGRGLPISSLASGDLIATAASPMFQRFSGGTWSGWVRYMSDPADAGTWTANLDIRDTLTRVPGVAAPLEIASASVELDGADVTLKRMRLGIDNIDISGDYSYTADGDRHLFNVAIPAASAQDIERFLMPTLKHSGLLARMQLTRAAVPGWLRERHAEGIVRVAALGVGDITVRGFRTRLDWSGPVVRLSEIDGRIEEGRLTGDASLDLTKAEPQYKLNANIANVTWRGGKLDVSGSLTALGTNSDFLLNLQSQGAFQARSVDLVSEYPIQAVSGSYGLAVSRLGPQIKLTSLQAAVGAERFQGQGSTQSDGRLQLELNSANRVIHVSGSLAPLRLEVTTERAASHTR